MRKLVKLVALAALLVPMAASAQLSLGARVGYAFPTGKIADQADADLKEWFAYQIPLQVEAAYRLTPDLSLGAYFSAGYASTGDLVDPDCDVDGVDCSARVLRLGVQLGYVFNGVSPSMAPWVGLGTGYEWAKITEEGGGEEVTVTAKGWEIVNVQGGVDFKVSPQFAVGPFLQYSLGQYGRFELEDVDGNTIGGDVDEKDMHGWFQIGLRGRFDL